MLHKLNFVSVKIPGLQIHNLTMLIFKVYQMSSDGKNSQSHPLPSNVLNDQFILLLLTGTYITAVKL